MGELVDKTLLQLVSEILKQAIAELYPNSEFVQSNIMPHTEFPRDSKLGDVSSNVSMKLAKELKKAPIEIAKEISSKILETGFFENADSNGNSTQDSMQNSRQKPMQNFMNNTNFSWNHEDLMKGVDAVNPGFINFTLSAKFYANYLSEVYINKEWRFAQVVD